MNLLCVNLTQRYEKYKYAPNFLRKKYTMKYDI
jgi:hypothetical protein